MKLYCISIILNFILLVSGNLNAAPAAIAGFPLADSPKPSFSAKFMDGANDKLHHDSKKTPQNWHTAHGRLMEQLKYRIIGNYLDLHSSVRPSYYSAVKNLINGANYAFASISAIYKVGG